MPFDFISNDTASILFYPTEKSHRHLYFELNNKILYHYPPIASFDIFCQQKVNWIYNYN
jgi:hypothetical protein